MYANPEIELDLIGVDFAIDRDKVPSRFNTLWMDFGTQLECKNMHKSPQYGDFLNAYINNDIHVDDDIIIFIDGDVILQRSFTQDELNIILKYNEGDFGVNYNENSSDSILKEAYRLQVRQNILSFMREWWPDSIIPPCYNTGVSVASGKTWSFMASKFKSFWKKEQEFIVHPSAQWLMSWLLSKDSYFNLQLLSLSFHTHSHFGLYPGITIDTEDGETTRHDNEICLFRHKIAWN